MLCLNGLFVSLVPRPRRGGLLSGKPCEDTDFSRPIPISAAFAGRGGENRGAHHPLPCGEIIRMAYRALPHALAPSTPASRAASSRNVR